MKQDGWVRQIENKAGTHEQGETERKRQIEDEVEMYV